MKALGVIPARIGSTRLPKKPLTQLLNKTVIERVYENMKGAKSLSMVVVATDSDEIRSVCEKAGAKVLMTNPNHPSGSDRVFEASEILKKQGNTFDIIVNIQGDLPFLKSGVVDSAVNLLKESNEGIGITTIGTPILNEEEYNRASSVKIVCNKEGKALYFSRSPIPHGVTSSPFGLRHLGLYAYRAEVLKRFTTLAQTPLELEEKLEQLRALENSIGIGVSIIDRSYLEPNIEIDTDEDVERAVRWLKSHSA